MIFHLLIEVAGSGSLIDARLLQLHVPRSIKYKIEHVFPVHTHNMYIPIYMAGYIGQHGKEENST